MANIRRGEINVHFAHRTVRLCLTFGALASLETRLNLTNLSDLGSRFARTHLSARDLLALIASGLEGSGDPMTETELRDLSLAEHWTLLVDAAHRLLSATFGDESDASQRP